MEVDVEQLQRIKKPLRAQEINYGKAKQPKDITRAQEIVNIYKKKELEYIIRAISTDAFADICDLLKIEDALQGQTKKYGEFADDFYKLGVALKSLVK